MTRFRSSEAQEFLVNLGMLAKTAVAFFPWTPSCITTLQRGATICLSKHEEIDKFPKHQHVLILRWRSGHKIGIKPAEAQLKLLLELQCYLVYRKNNLDQLVQLRKYTRTGHDPKERHCRKLMIWYCRKKSCTSPIAQHLDPPYWLGKADPKLRPGGR